MSKHTPWKAVQGIGANNQSYDVDDSRGHEVARELTEDDARLFAAAPDLAESVRCILHHIKFCGENDCDEWELAVAKLEQALTKAGIPVPNPDEHSEEK